jgi:hypothetical protein
MKQPESRNAPSPEAASDDFASYIHPPQCGDRLAFEPVPLRYRSDGLTPDKQRAYVEALADTGVAREAAARVGLSEQAINRVRRRRDARSFDSACEAAHMFGARRLRSIAWERAVEGTLKGHYYHGELISQERVYDNRLLIYLLGKVEHLLRSDDRDSRAIGENWEDCMEALERGRPLPIPGPEEDEKDLGAEQVWMEDGVWWTLFPPPAGFDGEEQGTLGDSSYQRTLSAEEKAAMRAKRRADEEAEFAHCCAIRDRFFGLPPRGAEGFSLQGQAEPIETSEPSDPDLGPIEYKSLFPPAPAPSRPSAAPIGIHAQARRRGGPSRSRGSGGAPPATVGSDLRPASPRQRWKRGLLRASAPPREPDPEAPNLSPAPRIP